MNTKSVGKVYAGIVAMVFTCVLPSIVIAESEIKNNPVEQSVILDNLVIDSQPLDVNAVSVAQDTEVTAVSESEVTSPAPVKLALVEQADHGQTSVANERGLIEAVSPLSVVDGESSQMPFALLLALLALIAVVPMSRRH